MHTHAVRSLFGSADGNPSAAVEQERYEAEDDTSSSLDEYIEDCGKSEITCPRQGTVTYWNLTHSEFHMVRTTCGTWTCPYCGPVKRAQLFQRVKAASPNRFVTLTTCGHADATPRQVYDWSRRQISELAKSYRRDQIEFQYLRVLEATKTGYPHYHLLVRSPYLDQKELSHRWCHLTQAFIVDIRVLSQDENGARYVMKYLTKQGTVPFTNRRLSWTRNFFPKEEKKATSTDQLAEVKSWSGSPEDVSYYEFPAANWEIINKWHWIGRPQSWLKNDQKLQSQEDSPESQPKSENVASQSASNSKLKPTTGHARNWFTGEPL